MDFAGIDSKKFVREGKNRDFIAIIGLCVIVEDYEKFKEEYCSIIERLFKKRNQRITKKIYKSHEIHKLSIGPEFFKEFYDEVKDKIKKLYICYSYFPNCDVKIFPFDYKKEISVIEFLTKYLDASYPHVCLWELSKNGFDGFSYLDGVNGKVTDAWRAVETSNNFCVLPNGDKTNALISSADLLITFLDNSLLENRKKLNEVNIKEIFNEIEEKIDISFVSKACLYSITPLSMKQDIPYMSKLAHPTIYILKEKEKYVDDNAIENSPILRKICDFCFKNNGCYKFFDPKVDYEFISPEDYLVSFGDDAKKSIAYFKRMGYLFKEIKFEDLYNH